MTACIVGWAHTRFGKHENEDTESLIVRVATDAVRDAGLAPADIDAVYLGTFNGGFGRECLRDGVGRHPSGPERDRR